METVMCLVMCYWTWSHLLKNIQTKLNWIEFHLEKPTNMPHTLCPKAHVLSRANRLRKASESLFPNGYMSSIVAPFSNVPKKTTFHPHPPTSLQPSITVLSSGTCIIWTGQKYKTLWIYGFVSVAIENTNFFSVTLKPKQENTTTTALRHSHHSTEAHGPCNTYSVLGLSCR